MAKKQIIRHVCGNYIQFKIPLNVRATTTNDVGVTDVDDAIAPVGKVTLELFAGVRRMKYTATIQNSVAIVEDNGALPLGVYSIRVRWRDANNHPMSYTKRNILEVIESFDAGVKYDTDEYDIQAYYPIVNGLRSAIVIENGKIYLEVGGHFGEDDDPNDRKAMITTGYGEGYIEREEGKIILNI